MDEKVKLIKEELRNLLSKARLREVIGLLDDYLTEAARKQVTMLSARLSLIQQDRVLIGSGSDTHRTEKMKIIESVIHFVDELRPEDFSQIQILKKQIHESILVVCPNALAKSEMEKFFKKHYFIGVEYDTSNQLLEQEKLNEFDILIFNEMYLGKNDSPIYTDLLMDYLDEREINVLYFGKKQKNCLKEDTYAHKLYGSNSIFSLYARIQEMITFRKYYAS